MIELTNVSFAYRRSRPLFEGLNLTLKTGAVYGLFGVNGSGKTTLIRLMAGMLFPHSGSATLNNIEARTRSVEGLRDVFIIPEEFSFPRLSGRTYVELYAPFYPNFSTDIMLSVLKEFEIQMESRLFELSHGQKKKFLIAFALATQTRVLLLDEPTNGLDIPSKSIFRKLMARYTDENRCVLISTHQVRDLASIIDHVLILNKGTIPFHQSTEGISSKLSFMRVDEHEQNNVLYAESSLGGKSAIIRRSNNETDIDFELLFNGVIANSEIINKEFKN